MGTYTFAPIDPGHGALGAALSGGLQQGMANYKDEKRYQKGEEWREKQWKNALEMQAYAKELDRLARKSKGIHYAPLDGPLSPEAQEAATAGAATASADPLQATVAAGVTPPPAGVVAAQVPAGPPVASPKTQGLSPEMQAVGAAIAAGGFAPEAPAAKAPAAGQKEGPRALGVPTSDPLQEATSGEVRPTPPPAQASAPARAASAATRQGWVRDGDLYYNPNNIEAQAKRIEEERVLQERMAEIAETEAVPPKFLRVAARSEQMAAYFFERGFKEEEAKAMAAQLAAAEIGSSEAERTLMARFGFDVQGYRVREEESARARELFPLQKRQIESQINANNRSGRGGGGRGRSGGMPPASAFNARVAAAAGEIDMILSEFGGEPTAADFRELAKQISETYDIPEGHALSLALKVHREGHTGSLVLGEEGEDEEGGEEQAGQLGGLGRAVRGALSYGLRTVTNPIGSTWDLLTENDEERKERESQTEVLKTAQQEWDEQAAEWRKKRIDPETTIGPRPK